MNFDQRGAGAASGETSSGQIIRYLTRADVLSNSAVLWGILTSGRYWRLYYQRAKSRLEDYFEIDLAWALGLPGTQGELQLRSRPPSFSSDEEYAEHLVTLMWVMFRREAFLPDSDGRTFHELALAEGRNWEARVRESLAGVVFGEVFPDLLRALVRADPARPTAIDAAYLRDLRDAALTLLYRLLFALYAEDRDLLPRRDPRYDDYGLSHLRNDVAERLDANGKLSARSKVLAHRLAELFRLIGQLLHAGRTRVPHHRAHRRPSRGGEDDCIPRTGAGAFQRPTALGCADRRVARDRSSRRNPEAQDRRPGDGLRPFSRLAG